MNPNIYGDFQICVSVPLIVETDISKKCNSEWSQIYIMLKLVDTSKICV